VAVSEKPVEFPLDHGAPEDPAGPSEGESVADAVGESAGPFVDRLEAVFVLPKSEGPPALAVDEAVFGDFVNGDPTTAERTDADFDDGA
jgi:hypothetical protein